MIKASYYSSMKSSGIEWIGDIPETWQIGKVKYAFDKKKEKAHEDNPTVLSLARSGVKIRDLSTNEGQIAESYYDYNPVEPGDLLLNPMDLYSGANCSVSKVHGVISPAYFNLRAREGYDSRYYDYYFKVQYWTMAMFAHGKGVSFDNRWTMNADTLGVFPIIIPSFEEQTCIADYLDLECNKIDTLIDEAEKSIEDYLDWRQAVVCNAVTRGIGKKDYVESGYEWLGKMPADWELIPFKYVLKERNERNDPVKSEERLSLSIDLGVTLYADKTTNLDRFKEDFTQYKLAYEGDLVMNSMNMIVGASGVSKWFGCVSPAYYVFYDSEPDHVTAKYCEYLFRSNVMKRLLHSLGRGIYAIERGDDRINTCRLKVPRGDLGCIKIPLPDIEEQREIIDYLNDKCNKIDAIIEEKKKLISELDTLRRAIIFEAVTGKRKVG